MAALSRGLGLGLDLSHRIVFFAPRTTGQSCLHTPISRLATPAIRCSPIIQAARNLQTSACLHAKKRRPSTPSTSRATPPPPIKPIAKATPASAPASAPASVPASEPASEPASSPPSATKVSAPAFPPPPAAVTASILARLAAREKPTVLYQCPSHFWLYFSSFAAATFCIAYALINYMNVVVHPPEGLAWWIPHGFAVICLFMGGFGLWFLYSSAFIVRRVTAVPTRSLSATQLRAAGLGVRAAGGSAPVLLECQVSSIVPFLQPRKVLARPDEVLLPFRFADLPMAKAPEAAAPRSSVGVLDAIATPFRVVNREMSGAFGGLRRGLLRQGFAPIKVKGRRYKIDVTGGTLFERGKVLDQIVLFKPNRFLNPTWQEKLFII